jgi:hypothetical protein
MKPKLPAIDMSRFNMSRIKVDIGRPFMDFELRIAAKVKHAASGDEIDITQHTDLPLECSDEELKQHVRQRLIQMLTHELDECLYIDGERLCKDPHPELAKK